MATTIARLATTATIETDASQTAADSIASEIIGAWVHASQSGRLGRELTVHPDNARAILAALRASGHRAWVTYTR